MSTPAAARDSSTVDFGRCFRFVTEDPDWVKKVLIGGGFTLLSALIVGMFFVAGYWVRFLRRVAAGDPRPLPEWDDLGGIFSDGLKVVGTYFAYVLGILAVVVALGCVVGMVGFGIGGLPEGSDGARSAAAALGGLALVMIYAVLGVLGLALAIFLPAVFVRVALKDRFEEAFAFRETVRFIQANLGNYALSLVFYLVANFASQFGVLLCCVGVFPAVFWSYLVLGYALAETVRLNPGSV
jgi:hypothetical protein